ncbi:glycosyltransferase family 2 protein [Aeromonas sp.]|uniref:glycosyltransferase family 2 protein n=1 Tax=Aeromonas sp. TaxID=647 RepID=UPI00258E84AE|nr:glycosyltransferase family 2 protein [Aeromonas sp.]MCX7131394.1 glycosyltransferase family 2 protein [Aeromonas sp.]
MLNRLRFLWRYRQNRYTHAMAGVASSHKRGGSRKELWALYRLNMYRSVAQAPETVASNWRAGLAKAVSLAACGEVEAARHAVAAFHRKPGRARRKVALANALAPFMPAEALQLIEDQPGVPTPLHIALLLRNNQIEKARGLLDDLPTDAAKVHPELHLLHTNAYSGTPAEQLQRLNAYLTTHGVAPLCLLDHSRAPSPLNIASIQPPPTQDGPLISILMTTFNTGPRAEAAIRSLQAQSHRTLELIIVDDASSDDTPARLATLATQDTRIRLVRLPHNVGTYAAKRMGLRLARGEFVTCHDSDDWSHPDKLARQLAPLLADPSLICTLSNWVRIQDDGSFYARPVYPLTRLNPSSLLFRREPVLREAGTWDCVRTGADSEFLARLKLVFGTKAVKKVNQPLTLGSHRTDSLMTAAGTGYSETGVSPPRLAYWEAWSQWHIRTLAAGKRPYIDANLLATSSRPFAAPHSLLVDPADIAACKKMLEMA